ncbi:MAG TPA: signal peptidase I [Solirubrobacteraceae bacterium]|jgi:signal peptidase I
MTSTHIIERLTELPTPPLHVARQAVSRAATALLAALLLLALAVAAAAAAGVAPHVELSDSMRPTLRAGDVVWLDRIAARDAAVGDVVAFDDPEHAAAVLHRVERVKAMGGGRLSFTTRGDAINTPESWTIPAAGSIGRYAGVRLPHVGRTVRGLAGPPLAAIALLSAALLPTLALRRIWSS